jgi:putative transposase
MNYHPPFFENEAYHILNRAHGDEALFRNQQNYIFFLEKIRKYILPIADIYAYCLMPNHYHLLIKLKPTTVLEGFSKKKDGAPFDAAQLSALVSLSFNRLQNSYAKAYNKYYSRKGGVFMSPFRRVLISTESQLCNTIFYIHKNPVHHGICKSIADWKFSSYHSYYSDTENFISKNEVLPFFDGIENFSRFHSQPIERKF